MLAELNVFILQFIGGYAVVFQEGMLSSPFSTSDLPNTFKLYTHHACIHFPPPPPPFPPLTMKTALMEPVKMLPDQYLIPDCSTLITKKKGDQDVRGPKGEKGRRGRKGHKGQLGEVGPEGNQGLVGAMGPPGEQGEKGEMGWAGFPGDGGVPGKIKGHQGRNGMKGRIGERGDQGQKGDKGGAGYHGLPGQKGDPGPKGWNDPNAVQGPRGAPGQRGKLGAKGDSGPPGPVGHVGPMGHEGDTGDPGLPGKVHIIKGSMGERGSAGPSVKCNCSWATAFEGGRRSDYSEVPSIYIVDSERQMSKFKSVNMMVLRRDTRTLYIYNGRKWMAVQVSSAT